MRTSFAAAVLVAAALSAPSFGAPEGVTNGVQEHPRIKELKVIRALEQEALALAGAVMPQTGPIPAETAATITEKLNQAVALLTALETAIAEGGPYQETTLDEDAIKDLGKAKKDDQNAIFKMTQNKPASKVVSDLVHAERYKGTAQADLMGLPITPKDAAAIAANNVSDETAVHDGDLSANKKDLVISKEKKARKRADAMNARGKIKKEPKPDWYPDLTLAATAGPPQNAYYAFEGTGAVPSYIFSSFDRQLFGPFETRFQVGSFVMGENADTGSACIEFDVEGSDPLQFVAVCGRRISGGVQVFVQTHNGAAGNTFFAGASIAQVLVDYTGTQFVVKAGSGRGAPDFALSTVATVNLAQGETALVAGLGASGLTKGAEIGLDEIFISAK